MVCDSIDASSCCMQADMELIIPWVQADMDTLRPIKTTLAWMCCSVGEYESTSLAGGSTAPEGAAGCESKSWLRMPRAASLLALARKTNPSAQIARMTLLLVSLWRNCVSIKARIVRIFSIRLAQSYAY